MSYSDIDVYLSAHGIDCKGFEPSTNSKWVYVKELLADAPQELVLTIADDLEMEHAYTTNIPKEATFWKTGYFRLFLSHLASFKIQASRLQTALSKYGISSFVAHEDIEPSKEWQQEIEASLHTMDALSALLMPGFKESNWCDQEVGVAVGKDVLIIPVRKKLDPYGFIGKYQGIQATNKNISEVADEIFQVIVKSPKTRNKMLRSLANAISQATVKDEAIDKIKILGSVKNIPPEILETLKQSVADNNVLINEQIFINDLNKILSAYSIDEVNLGGKIKPEAWDEIPF